MKDAVEHSRLPAGAKPQHLRTRVQYRAFRALVIAKVSVVGTEHEAAAEETCGRLCSCPELVEAAAANQVESQFVGALRIGHAGTGTDDAAKCVRAVGHRSRTADHLDLVDGFWVEIGGRRSSPPLRTDSTVIEKEQGAMLGQTANTGDRCVAITAGAGARQIFERLEELCRKPLPEITTAHHRRSHRRWQLEIGNDATDHGHGIAGRSHLDRQWPLFGDLDHGHRPQGHPIGACDEEHERNLRNWIENKSPVTVGDQQFAAANDGDPGTGEGGSVRQHDTTFDRRRSCSGA